MNKKEIKVGDIVLWNGGDTSNQSGWYRVTRVTKHTVNLAMTFHDKILHKGVPIQEVIEDRDSWYKAWSQSETYMCM